MAPLISSVKKIKKFRLQPRPSAVLKNLRALMEGAQATPELEKDMEAESRAALPLLQTAALYATFAPGQGPAWTEPLWTAVPDEDAPVALTLFAATIGLGLEGEIGRALERSESFRSRVLAALGEELADQSAHFVARLLAEEAKDDACELSDRRPLNAAEDQQALLETLDASRIPLSFDAGGHLVPRFSRLGYVLWWPPTKKKK